MFEVSCSRELEESFNSDPFNRQKTSRKNSPVEELLLGSTPRETRNLTYAVWPSSCRRESNKIQVLEVTSPNDYVEVDPSTLKGIKVKVYDLSQTKELEPIDYSDDDSSGEKKPVEERMLLLLDLVGTLVDREYRPFPKPGVGGKEDLEGGKRIGSHIVWKRPYLKNFLEQCFRDYDVAVWSTLSREDADPIVDYVFKFYKHHLLAVLDQESCEQIPDPRGGRPIFIKKLSDLWSKNGDFSKDNTLLLDGATETAAINPPECSYVLKGWKRTRLNDIAFRKDSHLSHYLEGRATQFRSRQ